MSTKKSQKRKNQIDWFFTIAGLALIVFICAGYYYHTHPNLEIDSDNAQQAIENNIQDSLALLVEQKNSLKSIHEKNLQKLEIEIKELKKEISKSMVSTKKDLQDQLDKVQDQKMKLEKSWQKAEAATAETFEELKSEYNKLNNSLLAAEEGKS